MCLVGVISACDQYVWSLGGALNDDQRLVCVYGLLT